jgi:hypothetical protein
MDVHTAAAVAPQQPQQDCSLMKLPTELRIRIYELAMGHVIDDLYAQLSSTGPEAHDPVSRLPAPYNITTFYSAVLALPHTSRTLRAESLDTLQHLVLARLVQLSDDLFGLNSSLVPLNCEKFRISTRELADRIEEDMNKMKTARRLSYICRKMGWAWEEY